MNLILRYRAWVDSLIFAWSADGDIEILMVSISLFLSHVRSHLTRVLKKREQLQSHPFIHKNFYCNFMAFQMLIDKQLRNNRKNIVFLLLYSSSRSQPCQHRPTQAITWPPNWTKAHKAAPTSCFKQKLNQFRLHLLQQKSLSWAGMKKKSNENRANVYWLLTQDSRTALDRQWLECCIKIVTNIWRT